MIEIEDREKGIGAPNPTTINIDGDLNDKNVTVIPKRMDELPETGGEIFSSEDPLEFMMRYVGKRVKYEDTLIKLVILVMASAYTPNPLNIALESPQSEGKSYSLVEVSKLFPKNDVWDLGGMTPQVLTREKGYLVDRETGKRIDKDINELKDSLSALGNSEEDKVERKKLRKQVTKLMENAVKIVDMQGKILLFLEAPRTETFSTLRPILSRDKYEVEYKFVDKAYKNGPQVTMEARIRGWPVAAYATADAPKGNMWDQIRSRFIIVSPNMTPKKYKAANQFTASKYGTVSIPSKLKTENKELQQCQDYISSMKSILYSKFRDLTCKPYYKPDNVSFTWNPMAPTLERSFPSNIGQNMRDFKYFMSLMDISCLFSILNRPYFEIEGHPHWIVTKWDLKTVTEVFDNYHFFIKIGELPIKVFESVILKMELNTETIDEEYGFTKKELKKELGAAGYPNSERYIKDNILDQLEEVGLLSAARSGGDKRIKIYVPFHEEYQKLLGNSFLKIKYGSDEFKGDYEGIKKVCSGIRPKFMNKDPVDEDPVEFIGYHFFSDHIVFSSLKPLESENTPKNGENYQHSNKNQHFTGKEGLIGRSLESMEDEDINCIASNPNDPKSQDAFDELSKRRLEQQTSKIHVGDMDYIDQAIIETMGEGRSFKRKWEPSRSVVNRYSDFDETDVKYRIAILHKEGMLESEQFEGGFLLKVNPKRVVMGD